MNVISSGTIPELIDLLIIIVIGVLIDSGPSLINLASKPSRPVLLLTLSLFNSLKTKSSLISLIWKV